MSATNTCCFFGHRAFVETEESNIKLYDTIEKLITNENVDTFLFGSKSQFNDFCLALDYALKKGKRIMNLSF